MVRGGTGLVQLNVESRTSQTPLVCRARASDRLAFTFVRSFVRRRLRPADDKTLYGHGSTCQAGYAGSATAIAALRAQELRTAQEMREWDPSTCGASFLDSVKAMASTLASDRSFNSSADAPLTCSVVFIGDSHTLQAFDAAKCSVEQSVRPREHRSVRAPPSRLQQWLWGAEAALYPTARVTPTFTLRFNTSSRPRVRQHEPAEAAAAREAIGPRRLSVSQPVSHAHQHRTTLLDVDLALGFIPRSKRASLGIDFGNVNGKDATSGATIKTVKGPGPLLREAGDVLDPRVLGALIRALGPCTLIIWNEGMHSGRLDSDTFRANVRYALAGLSTVAAHHTSMSTPPPASSSASSSALTSARPAAGAGPFVLAWEVVAQHFRTAEGDGLFEHSDIGKNYHRHYAAAASAAQASAPPTTTTTSSSSSSSSYSSSSQHSGTSDEGHEELASHSAHTRKALGAPDDVVCATTNATVDWRNAIIADEALKATPWPVPLVPFHRYSQPWGAVLHRWKADCSHVCYTPYYHAPLWHGIHSALTQAVWATETSEPSL